MKNFDRAEVNEYLKKELAKTKEKIDAVGRKTDEKLKPIYERINANCEKINNLTEFKEKMKLVDEDIKLLDKASKILDHNRRVVTLEVGRFGKKFCKKYGLKISDLRKFAETVDFNNIDLANLEWP